MGGQQRLIVCLDGTWNRQDSSTNVLHHFNVVQEGVDPATGLIQKKYYHPGVGTGVLDSITGGGFGFGLEQNVRDAYNWLIENYHDGAPNHPPDEIYIFGFSRGAYTARSLVGFIGQCGLLRRGAPIPVTQLWQDYCILGRQKEERRSPWDKLFWKSEARMRQITELTPDPWGRPRDPATDLNPSERLLVNWSRRVRITYLGIYDTVGAIGWDVLAIPGVTSRLALHNNMRPTTLIQHCRHALAVDEHRSPFSHTPFLAFVGHDAGELERSGDAPDPRDGVADAREHWEQNLAMWWRKIEQRWFVGAHSNVGGGYEDNRLAERPLQWVFEGAAKLGLVAEPIRSDPPVTQAVQLPRDSYAEFAPPLWSKIIRAKPNYRAIDPEPFPRASGKKPKDGVPAPGFSLQTIHEDLDDSVIGYWKDSQVPLPPNLQEYTDRHKAPIPGATPAAHQWLADKMSEYVAVVMWATLGAAGCDAADRLAGLVPAGGILWLACAIAFLLPLVDWSESVVHFKCASGWRPPRERAFLDAIYWTRGIGFVLFVLGAVHAIAVLPQLGWRLGHGTLTAFAETYWPVPVCAAVAALAASKFRAKAAWASLIAGPVAIAAVGGVLVAVGWSVGRLFPEIPRAAQTTPFAGCGRSVPGLLLLLQMALVYLWRAKLWKAEPMAKANLGSTAPLRRCPSPAKVAACLERWRSLLECRWLSEDRLTGPAAVWMRELLGQTLWRDIIGFIPVYFLVFLFGLWFAASAVPGFGWLNQPGGGLAWWWLLPLIAAGTGYIEDACHLRCGRLHQMDRPPSAVLTLLSWSMAWIRVLAGLVAFVLTLAAVIGGTWQIRGGLADWRAKIALLITGSGVAVVVLVAAVRVGHIVNVWRKRLAGESRA